MSVNRPRRPRVRRQQQAGFTLLEIVLAFSILAIGMMLAMQSATAALHQAQQAAEQTEVALWAQNLLDGVGLDKPLEVGEDSGEFGDDSGYRWHLTVEPYEAPVAEGTHPPAANLSLSVQLVQLDLSVEWQRGEQTREAHFRTLRALLPQSLQLEPGR